MSLTIVNLYPILVILELFEKHCLPIILSSIEVLDLSIYQQKDINSWWNNVFHKIFGFRKWESVKEVIFLCDRINIIYMINM